MRRKICAMIAAIALLGTLSAPAFAELDTLEAETTTPVVDALLMRPLGLVGLAASAFLWVPVEAVQLAVDHTKWRDPVDAMLVAPYEFVFVDPLGSH